MGSGQLGGVGEGPRPGGGVVLVGDVVVVVGDVVGEPLVVSLGVVDSVGLVVSVVVGAVVVVVVVVVAVLRGASTFVRGTQV